MPDFVNASSAAELLGVDKRTVLRMARSGRLRSFRTPGGQHRFRREDVEKLRAGDSGATDSVRSPSTVQNKRDEVDSLNLDVQARRASRELRRLEDEDEAADRGKQEARRAEALANRRALAEIRAKQERERREYEAAQAKEAEERQAVHAREAAERERRVWQDQTITEALTSLPHDTSPEERASAGEILREALAQLGPNDSRAIVRIAIEGATAKALGPWRRRKEIAEAIAEGENVLTWQARSICDPTEWQIRYRAAADAAIRALPGDAAASQLRAAAQGQARKLTAEFEHIQAEERHRRACKAFSERVFLLGATSEEETVAKQAVRVGLDKLPVGASESELRAARDAALAPLQAKIEASADADRNLSHVPDYVEKLGHPERGKWDLGDSFERSRLAERLRKRIRPLLVQAILSHNVQDKDEAREFIEDAVESELDRE